MTFKDQEGRDLYAYGLDTDPMLRAFFSSICNRESCYDCCFKKRYHVSDFTIWDCNIVDAFDKTMDDDKGTTRVLIHSDKGRLIFNQIKDKMNTLQVEPDQLVAGVKEMFTSVKQNNNREQFFIDANIMSGKELFDKYFPDTIKVKLERTARLFCYKTGIYSVVKHTYKKLLKK